MSNNTYKSLPLDTLYELLTISVRDMLDALDAKDNPAIAFKALKKQVEVLLTVIEEKKNAKQIV